MKLDFDPFMRFEQLEQWTEALRREAPHLVRTGGAAGSFDIPLTMEQSC